LSDDSDHRRSKDFWKGSDTHRNLETQSQLEWEISQDKSDEEISEAIPSTTNIKSCSPDEIPMEFFKALIPWYTWFKRILMKIIVNISSGFKYLKALINRIWNDDFPESWK